METRRRRRLDRTSAIRVAAVIEETAALFARDAVKCMHASTLSWLRVAFGTGVFVAARIAAIALRCVFAKLSQVAERPNASAAEPDHQQRGDAGAADCNDLSMRKHGSCIVRPRAETSCNRQCLRSRCDRQAHPMASSLPDSARGFFFAISIGTSCSSRKNASTASRAIGQDGRS